MMQRTVSEIKNNIQSQLDTLIQQVESGARTGSAAHTVEQSLFKHLLIMGHQLLTLFFQLQGDGDRGATLQMDDEHEVRRLECPRKRFYHSVFGEHELIRCVYGSREDQRIEYIPFDNRLQLPESKFSYLVQDWSQSLTVDMSFSQTHNILKDILNIDVSVSSLERITSNFSNSADTYWSHSETTPSEKGTFVVATADGKGVPIRKVSDSASIIDHDPSQKRKKDRKKMALLGAVYDSEPNIRTPEQVVESLFDEPMKPTEVAANEETFTPRSKPIAKAIRASLTHTDDNGLEINARTTIFGWMSEQVEQRDPLSEKPVVVIMDGQISLWNDAEQLFGERLHVEILDLLHATSKLWDAVHICYSKEREWDVMKFFTWLILQGKIKEVVVWFRSAEESCSLTKKEREKLNTICGYFERHQSRMRYDLYLAQGFPIASGVIEGACRHVVKDRLERTGMRWTIPGAQNMLNLRCVSINDQWHEYSQFHIDQENERLYGDVKCINDEPKLFRIAA